MAWRKRIKGGYDMAFRVTLVTLFTISLLYFLANN